MAAHVPERRQASTFSGVNIVSHRDFDRLSLSGQAPISHPAFSQLSSTLNRFDIVSWLSIPETVAGPSSADPMVISSEQYRLNPEEAIQTLQMFISIGIACKSAWDKKSLFILTLLYESEHLKDTRFFYEEGESIWEISRSLPIGETQCPERRRHKSR